MEPFRTVQINFINKQWKKFVDWRNSRPNVPWLSSWFPENEKRREELKNGAKRRWLDPWF